MEAIHHGNPVGGLRLGNVLPLAITGGAGALLAADTANGGTILLAPDAAATVTFVPPAAITRYRFVNTSLGLGYLYPVTIVTTDVAIPASVNKIVVFDGMDVIYYPGGGFITSGNPKSTAASLLSEIITAAGTSEQILSSVYFPAGSVRDFERIRADYSVLKSGLTDTPTLRFRVGALGTTADSLVSATAGMAGSSYVGVGVFEFKRMSSVSLKMITPKNQFAATGNSSLAFSDTTLSSMDTNGFYITMTSQMSGSADVLTCREFSMEIKR